MLAAAPTQCQEKRPVAHSPKRKLFLDLVLSLFRLNGLLVAEGDSMARAAGLTSARWKVIGVIALAHSGVTVPGIARVLGQSRQAVQRITDVMEGDGLLQYLPNPEHKRSPLVSLTDAGQDAYTALRAVQDPWAIDNTEDISAEELESALLLVRRLINRFDRCCQPLPCPVICTPPPRCGSSTGWRWSRKASPASC